MKAPKRFIKLIEDGNLKEVEEWLIDYGGEGIHNIRIELRASGEYQGEDEYCLQDTLSTESGCYAFEGTYYHKIEDKEKYVAYDFYMEA